MADKPWRLWISGGLAAVLAAAAQGDVRNDTVRWRASRWSTRETIQRIELVARDHGLSVFARLSPRAAQRPREWLIVLGSDPEHTVVMQSRPGAPLELPLTVRVADGGERGAAVAIDGSGRWVADGEALPPDVAERLATLPQVIDAALG